jgi:hypothetical protein
MFPSYSTDMLGFDPETIELLKLGLKARFEAATEHDQVFAVNAIVQYLKLHRDSWQEPDDAIASAERALSTVTAADQQHAVSSAPATTRASPSTASTTTPANVPAAAQPDFARAKQAVTAGHLDEAWSVATTLARAHPQNYAIAELLCDLANRRRLPFSEIETHCTAMMTLAAQGAAH